MCRRVKCEACGKSTWAGCGRHVASVHGQIADGQHCSCRDWPGVVPAVAVAAAADSAAACTTEIKTSAAAAAAGERS
ncbi:hypothetical protein GUJ93_ZPchr0003g18375 [Zizania palustris]|uniref:Uncharacterized protein n=1 Tax=Zizania palustris TaxID=103762 RepID=A0A8J5SUR4_ZIZPA|nr:hypothetical protein GUJ93_ZPchr0003g18375 [Zizania palustris]